MNTAIIISILAILFSYLESKKYVKYGLAIAIAIITVFVAIRFEWGTDMDSYFANFQRFADSGLKAFDFQQSSQIREGRSNEIGWAAFNILCKPIGFFGMIIVIAIIENLIIYDTIKRYVDKKYYWLAIFIYCFNPYLMVLGCSMIRQWLAMCIVLFSVRFIVSGRFWVYLLLVLLATSIHGSALFFIVLYLFRFLKGVHINTRWITILCIIAFSWFVIGSFFARQSVSLVLTTIAFENYADTLDASLANRDFGRVGLSVIFKVVLYIFCVVQTNRLSDEKGLICWLLMLFILIHPFTSTVPLASRLNFYIELLAMIAIPIAMKVNKTNALGAVLVVLFLIWNVMSYTSFFSSPDFNWAYKDYHTIFESPVWQ